MNKNEIIQSILMKVKWIINCTFKEKWFAAKLLCFWFTLQFAAGCRELGTFHRDNAMPPQQKVLTHLSIAITTQLCWVEKSGPHLSSPKVITSESFS